MPALAPGDLSPDRTCYWNGDIWGWQLLWLTPGEIVALASDHFDVRGVNVTFLGTGLLNQSWRLDTACGTCVLRVSRLERTRAQIAFEHMVLQTLHEDVDTVIPPLPGTNGATIHDGYGHLISLFPFILGESGTNLPAATRAREAAHGLARLHTAARDRLRLPQRPGFRTVDEHPRWIWPVIKPILATTLGGLSEFGSLSQAIEQEIAELDGWLDAARAAARLEPRVVVHGDFNPRNLLFLDRCLVAVIDWDDCRIEPVVWEVAQAAYAPDVDVRAFWQTYLAAGGPLAARDFDLLGPFARIGALSELRWTLDERDQPTPHALRQLRDVVASLSRLREREAGAKT